MQERYRKPLERGKVTVSCGPSHSVWILHYILKQKEIEQLQGRIQFHGARPESTKIRFKEGFTTKRLFVVLKALQAHFCCHR